MQLHPRNAVLMKAPQRRTTERLGLRKVHYKYCSQKFAKKSKFRTAITSNIILNNNIEHKITVCVTMLEVNERLKGLVLHLRNQRGDHVH